MTELSQQARQILDQGAAAALPPPAVGDANWAALTARIAAAPAEPGTGDDPGSDNPRSDPLGPGTPGAGQLATAAGKLALAGKLGIAAALVLGGAVALRSATRPPDHAPSTAPPSPASRPGAEDVAAPPRSDAEVDRDPSTVTAHLAASTDEPPPPRSPATASAPTPPRASAPSPSSPRPDASGPDDLADEERLVSAARRDLDRDPAAALRRLDEYRRRFRAGVLAQEAAATRVLALCRLGRRDEGARLADEFARTWPDAPALARVQAACRP
jgi:hypothetical protein